MPGLCTHVNAASKHTRQEESSMQEGWRFITHKLIEPDDLVVFVYIDNMMHNPGLVKDLSSAFPWNIIHLEKEQERR